MVEKCPICGSYLIQTDTRTICPNCGVIDDKTESKEKDVTYIG